MRPQKALVLGVLMLAGCEQSATPILEEDPIPIDAQLIEASDLSDRYQSQPELPKLAVHRLLDLHEDGAFLIEFSNATRHLFLVHRGNRKELNQWDLSTGTLLNTYHLPPGGARWDEAVVSPDGALLVAATYPEDRNKAKVLFIDTDDYTIKQTFEYEYLVRRILFNTEGDRIWIIPTFPGPDEFVRDRDGNNHTSFNSDDFASPNRQNLWIIHPSKGVEAPGLFYKDANGMTHKLISDPLDGSYYLTTDGRFIGSSTNEGKICIWRTSNLEKVYDEFVGLYAVQVEYDSVENRFLFITYSDGDTFLKTILLPND